VLRCAANVTAKGSINIKLYGAIVNNKLNPLKYCSVSGIKNVDQYTVRQEYHQRIYQIYLLWVVQLAAYRAVDSHGQSKSLLDVNIGIPAVLYYYT